MQGVHFNREHWKDILEAPKGGLFLLDEGANVAISRQWMQSEQTEMMKVLNMIRQRNHTLIWATPNIARLDIILREDLITHRINCFPRVKGRGARVQAQRFQKSTGEPMGWKTWHGLLTWPGLRQHPIWEPYTRLKAANFTKAVNSMDIGGAGLEDPYAGKGALDETLVPTRRRPRSKT